MATGDPIANLNDLIGLLNKMLRGEADEDVNIDGTVKPTLSKVATEYAANHGIYPTVNEGLAAVGEGGVFAVVGSDPETYLSIYRNIDGNADFIVSSASSHWVSGVTDTALTIASKPQDWSGEFHNGDEISVQPTLVDESGDVVSAIDAEGYPVVPGPSEFHGDDSEQAVYATSDENGNRIFAYDADGQPLVPWISEFHNDKNIPAFNHVDDNGVIFLAWDESGEFVIGGGGGTTPESVETYFAFAEPWTDPSKDLAITWCCDSMDASRVQYRLKGSAAWLDAESQRSRPFPALSGKYLHTILLESLSPACVYELKVVGSSWVDSVRTSPRRDVRMVVASDYHNTNYGLTSILKEFGDVVKENMADFILFDGDFVSDNGNLTEAYSNRWFGFLQGFTQQWRNQGALIPVAATIGNHEASNSAGYSSALYGGDGIVGQIPEIFSLGYDTNHPAYVNRSAWSISIGSELFIVAVETDHTVPLPGQVNWLSAQLENNAASHRNVCVAGHSPAFFAGLDEWDHVDTQARTLRNQIWPIMSQYAEKIRAYWCGHEHRLTATERLRFDYDPGLSLDANDKRWAVDPVNGVRQLGSGTSGGSTSGNLSIANQVSDVDGSQKFAIAVGYEEGFVIEGSDAENFNAIGEGYHNIWIADFSAKDFTARCMNRGGEVFYTINENFGA